MSESVRCAVIGVGMAGAEHAEVLAALPEAELVACCDVDPARRDAVPAGAAFTTDLDELLAHPGLEAVVVCVPQHLHRPVTERALAAGLAVLCEKPIAHTLADADAMIAAARERDVPLVVGHTLRFDPDYRAAADAVAAGDVGEIVAIHARWFAPDFEGRVISGRTTVAQEMAIHDLDVVRWLAGPVERVYAEASPIPAVGPGPDAVVATLRLRSGAVAALDHGWIVPSPGGLRSDHRLALFGTRGTLYVESPQTPLALYGPRGGTRVNTRYRADVDGVPAGVFATEDRAFLRLVRGGGGWPVSLADARAALACAVAIDASIAAGAPVTVDDDAPPT